MRDQLLAGLAFLTVTGAITTAALVLLRRRGDRCLHQPSDRCDPPACGKCGRTL